MCVFENSSNLTLVLFSSHVCVHNVCVLGRYVVNVCVCVCVCVCSCNVSGVNRLSHISSLLVLIVLDQAGKSSGLRFTSYVRRRYLPCRLFTVVLFQLVGMAHTQLIIARHNEARFPNYDAFFSVGR